MWIHSPPPEVQGRDVCQHLQIGVLRYLVLFHSQIHLWRLPTLFLCLQLPEHLLIGTPKKTCSKIASKDSPVVALNKAIQIWNFGIAPGTDCLPTASYRSATELQVAVSLKCNKWCNDSHTLQYGHQDCHQSFLLVTRQAFVSRSNVTI